MSAPQKISRREFVIAVAAMGGGMSISILWDKAADVERKPWPHAAARDAGELSPWIVITPDDTVLIRVSSPESGNGALTQIAMTVTEELHCDWKRIKTEYVSMNRDFRENSVYSSVGGIAATFAGRSTLPERMKLLLQIGASARERLAAAAADRWNVPVSEIEAKDSLLTHQPSGRTLRFGEVAASAAAIRLKVEPQPKPPDQWRLLGKASPSKLNNPLIVNGSAVYGIDVRRPGMLYAALMQSPVHGGKLKRCDFGAIKNMPGVRGFAIVDPDEPRKASKSLFPNASAVQSAVAVVADHYWQARKALEALPVEWDESSGAHWKTTEQIYQGALATLERAGEKIEKSEGATMEVLGRSTRLVEATYLTPLCDQAPIEPLNGTALVTENRVEVWHPAAITAQAFLTAAEEAGVAPENTYFNQTFVGGNFGRRLFADDVRLVVAIAKKFPGRPVQVIWSREEAMRQGRYRELTAARFKASLGENGLPEALLVRVCRGGFELRGIADCAYTNLGTIANVHIESQPFPLHILMGSYRAPTYNSHAFFMESFIDECAAAAGIDPLEYRLRLLANWPDTGWKRCLEEVAAKSGWGARLPKGQGQGIAISNWNMGGKARAGTTVAAVATVEVTPEGKLKIPRLDLSFDCGQVLNTDAVLNQLQGGMIFGLNMSLNEELTVQDGRIVEGNFDQYPMLRMSDTPKNLHVHFGALSGHERITEVGEPPVGPIGPAVANAIFRATGKRIRTTPFRKHDLSWAASGLRHG